MAGKKTVYKQFRFKKTRDQAYLVESKLPGRSIMGTVERDTDRDAWVLETWDNWKWDIEALKDIQDFMEQLK